MLSQAHNSRPDEFSPLDKSIDILPSIPYPFCLIYSEPIKIFDPSFTEKSNLSHISDVLEKNFVHCIDLTKEEGNACWTEDQQKLIDSLKEFGETDFLKI
jgi:hypothetical protein